MAPVLVVTSSRGIARIKGADYKSVRRIPINVLNVGSHRGRMLQDILCDVEDTEMTKVGWDLFTKIRCRLVIQLGSMTTNFYRYPHIAELLWTMMR
uniref:Uncharacterized protein n=1 Tax=Physcomitrium patens TaxID=3218 RepID=A0A2K1IDV9_PHYPA|nr:hypothetical protein PHYPA_029617 [Physcomitrium patens]